MFLEADEKLCQDMGCARISGVPGVQQIGGYLGFYKFTIGLKLLIHLADQTTPSAYSPSKPDHLTDGQTTASITVKAVALIFFVMGV